MKKYIFAIACLLIGGVVFALTPLEKQKLWETCQQKKGNSFFLPKECWQIAEPKIKIEECLAKNIYSTECLDSCDDFFRDAKCKEYWDKFWAWEHEINKEYYDRMEKQTRLEQKQKKIGRAVAWSVVVVFFLITGIPLFVFLKNKFSQAKKKINLRHKQRLGKHTLDDVFAAEKRK